MADAGRRPRVRCVMIRVKIFSSSRAGSLERLVNEWLGGNERFGIVTINYSCSIAPLASVGSQELFSVMIMYKEASAKPDDK